MTAFETKQAASFELKSLDEDGTFQGLGAVYGNVDEGFDILDEGALTKSISEQKERGKMPKMLLQHNPAHIIGKWTSMESTADGLLVKGKLFSEIPRAKEAYLLLKEGELDGLSIGYRTKDYTYEKSQSASSAIRRIKEAELFEVSVVTFPMNTEARISAVKQISDIREIERILRDAGVPNSFAKLIATHGYKEAKQILDGGQRDADRDEVNRVLRDVNQNLLALKEIFNA